MKNQAFFSSKDKSEKLKCRLLQFLFGTLRVNHDTMTKPGTMKIYPSFINYKLKRNSAGE